MSESESPTAHEPTPPVMSRGRLMGLVVGFQGFGIIGLAVLLGWLFGERFWEATFWDGSDAAWGLALSLPLVGLVIWVSGRDWLGVRQMHGDFDRVVELFRDCTILDLAIISIFAGVGEEALFRGVIQSQLAQYLGLVPAVLVAAVIFGAIHALSVSYVIGVTLIGILLGAEFVFFDNLLAPMVTHASYDFVVLVYALRFRAPSGEA